MPKAKCPGCPPCCNGMPRWWVSEPYINLCMADTPLSYTMASGQQMSFDFHYRQRAELPKADEVPNFWSYVEDDPYFTTEDVYTGSPNGMTCGTNAFWGNNWNMSVLLWDAAWKNAWHSSGPFPPNSYYIYYPPGYSIFSEGNYEAFVFRPEGGIQYFNVINQIPAYQRDPKSQVSLLPVSSYPTGTSSPTADANGIYWGDSGMGVKMVYPDGSQEIFGLTTYFPAAAQFSGPASSVISCFTRFLLTERIDPQGRVTQLGYEKITLNAAQNGFRLKYVVDPDGRTNNFLYPANNTLQLAEIDDPYGRKTRLGYSSTGLLTNLIDAVGLTNSFQYSPGPLVTNLVWDPIHNRYNQVVIQLPSNGWITNLTTPYGNTRFSYYEVPDTNAIDGFILRAICASEPEGAGQLFTFFNYLGGLVAANGASPTVLGQTFDDGTVGSNHQSLENRNTFHWGRQQYAALSANVLSLLPSDLPDALANLTAADFRKGRLRHWLWQADNVSLSESMSSERDPSPDAQGAQEGLRTWYNYAGKSSSAPETLGNNPQVSCVARLLPDSSSQYTVYNFYPGAPNYPPGWGFVSNNISSCSLPGGAIGTLTNWYGYAANSVDLISIGNSAGQWVNLGYNANHQIISVTNALNQVTTLSWDSSTFNLTGIQWPNGQSASLNYYAQSSPPTSTSALLSQISIQPEGRTFTINTYQAGNPSSITDDRGVTVTNTWDGLNRLTSTSFPRHHHHFQHLQSAELGCHQRPAD